MSAARTASLLAGFAAVCACGTQPAQGEAPALIRNPSAQSRAELRRVLSTALNGAPVTIADDALTHSSVLIIERAVHRDSRGRPLTGRDLGRPVRFRLVRRGDRCLLVREDSGAYWQLMHVSCVPE